MEQLPQNDAVVDLAARPSGNRSVRKPRQETRATAACHRRWRAPPSLIHEPNGRLRGSNSIGRDDRQPDNLPEAFLPLYPVYRCIPRLERARGFHHPIRFRHGRRNFSRFLEGCHVQIEHLCGLLWTSSHSGNSQSPGSGKEISARVSPRDDALSASVARAPGAKTVGRRFDGRRVHRREYLRLERGNVSKLRARFLRIIRRGRNAP